MKPLEDAPQRQFTPSRGFWVGLGWSLLLCATLYFSLAVCYFIGYNNGYADNKPTKQACMSYAVEYGKCDMAKTSSYPRKVR